MANELGRVANVALRSASALRSSTAVQSRIILNPAALGASRCQTGATTGVSSQIQHSMMSLIYQRRYQSSWTTPGREARSASSSDEPFSKPSTSDAATSSSSSADSAAPADGTAPAKKPSSRFKGDEFVPSLSASKDSQFDYESLMFKESDIAKYMDDLPEIVRNPVRCVPRTGRTINLNKNTDTARAFQQLNMSCARNRVRGEERKQKFHERPGLRKKRLKSERWMRKFKEGFKATTMRVNELRRQGW